MKLPARLAALAEPLAALGIAVLVALATTWAAQRFGPFYPAPRARMLAAGWALVAVAALIASLLAREGGLAARVLGALGVDALAIEGYALLVPHTFWYGARRVGGHAMMATERFVLFRDFLASTMVAGLIAACAGLAFALWRPRRGTAAAAALILLVLGAAFAGSLLLQGRPAQMI